ncbi:MAG TPA: cellulase family glycosylhydrolase [Dictyoglomaceae bacterium]|nr:cellulase family glycosylhydrolase [Dictyoglomaceae bacterium]HOL39479.1 cellulase family glycosylhydrolase [Dictyoglomaceae bacterium]HPP15380.1 cellulase family glycosylhydrolase [Dictyoglomaceae bacterium]HPU43665.1 cellulase family glycosylhydrolase [Dictyoglomaceae bacterium]
MKKIVAFCLFIIFIFVMGGANVTTYQGVFDYKTPHQAVKEMDPGWNLGNSLDAIPDETSWGNPKTESYVFDDIKKIGFKSVRIPVTWVDHMGPAPDYKVDKAWMDRVEEVVKMALDRDLYVIINVHHDSWRWLSGEMKQDKEGTIKKLEKLWMQIADRFKDYSEKLIFEIVNEPVYEGYSDDVAGAIQNEVNEKILKLIRNSGGFNDKRLVVVPPLSTDTYKAEKYFVPPKDPNIIIGIHYYSPWDFTANWWGRKTWGTQADKEQMDKDIRIVKEKFRDYAFIIGEYGLFNGNKPAEWYWYDNLIRVAKKYDMATFYWDNGSNYDRRNRVWRDETSIRFIINASYGNPNSFLNPGVLFIKESENIKDKEINMELNGNELKDVYLGTKKLEKGKDYELNGKEKVILKSSLIKQILKPGEYGTLGTLIFKFTKSVDYPLEIVQYKNPVLLDKPFNIVRGVPRDLNFYIAFNGTRLCAIKVFGAKDGKPIRDSWTPYLRGWDDFSVNDLQVTIRKDVVEKIDRDVKIIFEFFPEGITLETSLEIFK